MTRSYTPVNYAPMPCTYCGTEFKPKSKRSIRCASDDCRKAHNRVKMQENVVRWSEELGYSYHMRDALKQRPRTEYDRRCSHCGTPFATRTRGTIYCGLSCAGVATAPPPTPPSPRPCHHCGEQYTPQGTASKYCTKACSNKAATQRSSSLRSPLRKAYEDNNNTMFFKALKKDCNIDNDLNCWTWKRMKNKNNYAIIKIKNKNVLLHRVSLEMKHGKPLGVLAAHHKCANTMCVNPEHLEPATAADNVLEMLARNSFIARIAELENEIRRLDPGNEKLNRVPAEK